MLNTNEFSYLLSLAFLPCLYLWLCLSMYRYMQYFINRKTKKVLIEVLLPAEQQQQAKFFFKPKSKKFKMTKKTNSKIRLSRHQETKKLSHYLPDGTTDLRSKEYMI